MIDRVTFVIAQNVLERVLSATTAPTALYYGVHENEERFKFPPDLVFIVDFM